MQAGFNWELGPFALWDAAGVGWTVERMKALGLKVSRRAEAVMGAGQASWYGKDGRSCFQPGTGRQEPVAEAEGHARIADFRRSNGVVRSNAGASLIDLGDGIGCI
jgi:3-hydroxyacyl-CoA dehydrogenase